MQIINLANVDGEPKRAAANISAMVTPQDQAQEEETPLVEWAFIPMGHCKPKEQ